METDFSGSSGIFSFVLKDASTDQAYAFLDALDIFGLGYSWGGFESLAVRVSLDDRTVSTRDYGGQVVRLNIGLEDVPDLKGDIEKGLRAAAMQPEPIMERSGIGPDFKRI